MSHLFTGVVSSMVTPFDQADRLDEARLRQLIDRQLEAGVNGLLIVGNCGEFANMTDQERIRAVEVSVRHIAGRAPVLAGDFHPNTEQAVALARAYMEVGAAAALVTPPYFMRPSLDGVVEYFKNVAEQSGLPIIVYNNPGRTGLDLTPEIMRRLYGLPGIVGLKDCTRDLAVMAQKVEESPEGFSVLYGDDDMFFEALLMGAVGGILAAANLVPEVLVEIYKETVAGDPRRASHLQNSLLPMIRSWYTANHPAPIKEAMAMIGWPVGRARKPLVSPTVEQSAEIRRALAVLGLLR